MTVDQIKAYLQEKKLDCIECMNDIVDKNSFLAGELEGELFFINQMLEWIGEQENENN